MSEYFLALIPESKIDQSTVSALKTEFLLETNATTTLQPPKLLDRKHIIEDRQLICLLAFLLLNLFCLLVSKIFIIYFCCRLKKNNNKIKSVTVNISNLQNRYCDIEREVRTIKRFCVSSLKVELEGVQRNIIILQDFLSNVNDQKHWNNAPKTTISEQIVGRTCVEKLDEIIISLEDAITTKHTNPFV